MSFAECDVLVAGAGPAGAAAATHIARAGLKVILLDRQKFPRDKVCGDFVGQLALQELEQIGVARFSRFRRTNVIRGAALYLDGEELIRKSSENLDRLPFLGRIIPRLCLDNWIVGAARAAGAELLEGHQIIGFHLRSKWLTATVHGGEGRKIIRTKLLIGADGSTSVVARLLRGRPARPRDRIIAIRAYLEGIDGPSDQADLYFSDEFFPGYCWLFPSGGGTANVGAGVVFETVPPPEEHLRDLLLRRFWSDRALNSRVRHGKIVGKVVGWPLATYNPSMALVGPRCLLVGDAAGLVNPLNGEGIQQALQSARWAAEAAVTCVMKGDFSENGLRSYAQRVERELRFDMAICSFVVQAIRNRILNPLWFEVLKSIVGRARSDHTYAGLAGGILAGIVPAKWALRMAVPTAEQFLASAALRAADQLQQNPAALFGSSVHFFLHGLRSGVHVFRNRWELLDWVLQLAWQGLEVVDQLSYHRQIVRA